MYFTYAKIVKQLHMWNMWYFLILIAKNASANSNSLVIKQKQKQASNETKYIYEDWVWAI